MEKKDKKLTIVPPQPVSEMTTAWLENLRDNLAIKLAFDERHKLPSKMDLCLAIKFVEEVLQLRRELEKINAKIPEETDSDRGRPVV